MISGIYRLCFGFVDRRSAFGFDLVNKKGLFTLHEEIGRRQSCCVRLPYSMKTCMAHCSTIDHHRRPSQFEMEQGCVLAPTSSFFPATFLNLRLIFRRCTRTGAGGKLFNLVRAKKSTTDHFTLSNSQTN